MKHTLGTSQPALPQQISKAEWKEILLLTRLRSWSSLVMIVSGLFSLFYGVGYGEWVMSGKGWYALEYSLFNWLALSTLAVLAVAFAVWLPAKLSLDRRLARLRACGIDVWKIMREAGKVVQEEIQDTLSGD